METGFYRAFEDKHRGSRDLIKSRLRTYLPFVEKLKTINSQCSALDLGCGRGEWLEILDGSRIHAHGVDMDEGMLEFCRTLGLSSIRQDILECLKNTPDESYLVISAFHVAEHIPFEQLQLLVSETLRVLQPGGVLILETPNPENLTVGTNSFYLDPTHQRPLPPALLSWLPEYHGFKRTKILRLQESPDLRALEEPELINVINGVSPDYAVIAQKDGSREQLDILNTEFDKEYGLDLSTLAHRYERKVMNIASMCRETNEAFQEQSWRVEQVEIALSAELTEKNGAIQRAEAQAALMKEKLYESESNIKVLHEKIINIHILLNKAEEQTLLWRRYAEEAKSRAQLLEAKITEVDNLYRHWRSIAETVQRQFTAILMSKTWRITRPLRLIYKMFRKKCARNICSAT